MLPRGLDLLDSYFADFNVTAIPFKLEECLIEDKVYLPFSINPQALPDIGANAIIIILINESGLRLKRSQQEQVLITKEYPYSIVGLSLAIKELLNLLIPTPNKY